MKIDDWFTNQELDNSEIVRRVKIATDWANGAQLILKKTKDAEVRKLIENVLNDVAVGKPDPKEYLIPVQGPKKPSIIFIPLFKEDADLSDTARFMMQPKASQLARYTENIPGRIYFNAEISISPLLKGLLLLHETKHAQAYETGKYRDGDEFDHWREEVSVFEFEFSLIKKLCGKPYEASIQQTVSTFIKKYDDKNGRGGIIPEPQSVNISSLDEVLDPCLDENEAEIRRGIVWLDAVFRMFEKIYPATAKKDKARFLRQIYEQ